jgi:hypothetical protein
MEDKVGSQFYSEIESLQNHLDILLKELNSSVIGTGTYNATVQQIGSIINLIDNLVIARSRYY